MSHEVVKSSLSQVRDIMTRLQSPIPDLPTLLSLLCGPLSSLNLLPPTFRKYNNDPSTAGTLNFARHIPLLQRALLEHVIPTWESTLVEEKKTLLLTQYFCPQPSFTSPAAGSIALLAYSSILSLPLTKYSISLLARLSTEYSIDKLHAVVFSSWNMDSLQKQSVTWEDCLRNVAAVPAKVANAAGRDTPIPSELERGEYFNNVSLRCEYLIFTLSTAPTQGAPISSRDLLLC
jgi:telomere length regulation protein